MELGLLGLMAVVIGAGVAGGLLTTWSVHRRLFRLEILTKDVSEVLTRQDKREAAKVRWNKSDQDALALAQAAKEAGLTRQPELANPWGF